MTEDTHTRGFRSGRWMLAAFVAAAGLTTAAPTQADIVFSDDFSDGDRTDPAWHKYARVRIPAGYDETTSLTVVDDGGNQALRLATGQTGTRIYRAAVANFDAVTLDNVGDYISLTFDARWVGGNYDRFFGFELMQSGGYYSSDTGGRSGFQGYLARLDAGAASGVSGAIYQDSTFAFEGHPDQLLPTTDSPDSFADDTYKRFELRITRSIDAVTDDPTDVIVSYLIDGVTLLEVAASESQGEAFREPQTLTFDSLAIGMHNLPASAAGELFIDNVVVTTGVIPEPASLALLGVGGLTLASRRRRA